MDLEPAAAAGYVRTILVVEDEPSVRSFLNVVLSDEGYRVLEAGSGFEALRLAGDPTQPIDLAVLDVILPDTDGVSLGRAMAPLQPGAKVLFISGYLGPSVMPTEAHFLRKPFRPQALLAKVREVLDRPGR